MPKIVLLRDILMHDEEEACRLFVNYEPDMNNQIVINAEGYSSMKESETVTPEANLAWHPTLYDGSIYIVSNPTEFKLYLVKSQDTRMSAAIIKQRMYAGIYAKAEFGTNPKPLRRDTFMKLPGFLKNVKGEYWLESEKFFSWINCCEIDLSKIEEIAEVRNVIDYAICLTETTSYDESRYILKKSMRMITALPIDIKVEIDNPERDGSSPEKALNMVW